jgi:hypothetical protein
VLIYAFRTDAENHSDHKRWLENVVNGSAAYGLSPQVLASLVRICTHRRVFARPSSLEDALQFCNALREQPNATIVAPGERHWSIFERLCRESRVAGNLAQDAWFAALAIESGCEWISTDTDYAKFPELHWRRPF